jgi:hypothetical protein
MKKYEYLTIEVPPETMASLRAEAKECSLDVGTWLSEVLEYMCRKDDFINRATFEAAIDNLRSTANHPPLPASSPTA